MRTAHGMIAPCSWRRWRAGSPRRRWRRRRAAGRDQGRSGARHARRGELPQEAALRGRDPPGQAARWGATSATCRRWWCWPRPTTTSTSTSWRRRIVDIAKSIDANNAECYNLLGFIALTRDDSHLGDRGVQEGHGARLALRQRLGQSGGAVSVRQELRRRARGGAEGDAADADVRQGVEQPRVGLSRQAAVRRGARAAYKRATQLDPNYADALLQPRHLVPRRQADAGNRLDHEAQHVDQLPQPVQAARRATG